MKVKVCGKNVNVSEELAKVAGLRGNVGGMVETYLLMDGVDGRNLSEAELNDVVEKTLQGVAAEREIYKDPVVLAQMTNYARERIVG